MRSDFRASRRQTRTFRIGRRRWETPFYWELWEERCMDTRKQSPEAEHECLSLVEM